MLLRAEHVGKPHRPAMCAGVVAQGYSLALPEENGGGGACRDIYIYPYEICMNMIHYIYGICMCIYYCRI